MSHHAPAPPRAPQPALLQRAGGVWIAALGCWLAWLAWRQGVVEGAFSLRAALLGPAFVVLGGGLALFGGYREERRARGESLEGLSGMQLLTRRWWAVLVLSLVAAAAFTLLLWSGWLAR